MSPPATTSIPANNALSTELFRYVVIDLASIAELCPVIRRLRPSAAQPLFARTSAQELLDVGPWLVRLSNAPEVERTLANMSPEVPWGYYVQTSFDIISLRQTLRRFNMVRVAAPPREVLFRYWDPRVMRMFLEVADSRQRGAFFEFIDRLECPNGSFDARASGEVILA